jgi:hypothetical protein
MKKELLKIGMTVFISVSICPSMFLGIVKTLEHIEKLYGTHVAVIFFSLLAGLITSFIACILYYINNH